MINVEFHPETDILDVKSIENALKSVKELKIDTCNWPEAFPYIPEVSLKMIHTGDCFILKYDVREKCTAAKVATDLGRTWTDSCVECFFPDIFERLLKDYPGKYGIFYNINFPALPPEQIKGVKAAHQGINTWTREVQEWNPDEILEHFGINISKDKTSGPLEEGEKPFMLLGTFTDDDRNTPGADFRLNMDGWISVVPDKVDMTDYAEVERLAKLGFNREFKK